MYVARIVQSHDSRQYTTEHLSCKSLPVFPIVMKQTLGCRIRFAVMVGSPPFKQLVKIDSIQQLTDDMIMNDITFVSFHKVNHFDEIVVLEAYGSLTPRTFDGMFRKVLQQAFYSNITFLSQSIASFVYLNTTKHSPHSAFANWFLARVKFIIDICFAVSVLQSDYRHSSMILLHCLCLVPITSKHRFAIHRICCL